jgi:hypothetical protein
VNKNQILVASALVVAGVTTAAYLNGMRVLHQDLYKRFPDLDHKVIRKAYKQFLKNAANQTYGDMDDFSDDKMDQLFLDIVREMTSTQK